METNQSNHAVRTVFAVTLITAALMAATNYAVRGAAPAAWWLPAALFLSGLVLARPPVTFARSALPSPVGHPTAAEIAEQVRTLPPLGEPQRDAPAGTDTIPAPIPAQADLIGQDADAPIHIEYHETGSSHEIPTLGVNPDAETTPPESGHPAESPAEPGEIPKEKPEMRDPQQFDSPGHTRETTADEGTTVDSSGTRQAVTPEQPAPTAEPPNIRYGTPDVTKEPGDMSAAIAPNSGESLTTDDLVKLDGIGARIAGVLIEAGIDTYVKLAAVSEERLREILTAAGIRLVPTIGTWADQAALASKGDWVGLKRLIAERKASRGSG